MLSILWFAVVCAGQQEKPVPAHQEPHHHIVFENPYVRVLHVQFAPGATTLYHIHTHDQAGVALVAESTTEQLIGEAEGKPETDRAGDIWAEAMPQPRVHRVHNVGSTPVDLIDIEFLKPSSGQASQAIAPVAAENAEVRVYRWDLAAGATSKMHAHTRPYLIVAVSPMRLKMTGPDGRSRTEDVKRGDIHWVDSSVTHSLTNEGIEPAEIVEFELK